MSEQPPTKRKTTVLIAGSTGYLGRYLLAEFQKQTDKYNVVALARRPIEHADPDTRVILAQATDPDSLDGVMNGVDWVVSALGITRQRGLSYREVDYQANLNLLNEATRTGSVKKFAYVHVLRGAELADTAGPAIRAKQDFVDELQQQTALQSLIICPSGFFSDMQDFLDMARQQGRVWLFGDGEKRLNPIHGADLAQAIMNAMQTQQNESSSLMNIGGPDIYTQNELARLALECCQKDPTMITHVWDWVRRLLLTTLPWVTPVSVYGPALFFLTALGMDMVGECYGTRHLRDHFMSLVESQE